MQTEGQGSKKNEQCSPKSHDPDIRLSGCGIVHNNVPNMKTNIDLVNKIVVTWSLVSNRETAKLLTLAIGSGGVHERDIIQNVCETEHN